MPDELPIIAKDESQYNQLTAEEERVILHKGTEAQYTGLLTKNHQQGTYTCKQCNAPLYRSGHKFISSCGWPSFDDAYVGAIKQITDADGVRTEIVCVNCQAHLGHIFTGEGFTPKNVRHCVNSISMNFVSNAYPESKTDRGIFASGCFWGTEYFFQKTEGVLSTTVGYIGGHKKNPTYHEICSGNTGHAEATEVIFDPAVISYEELTKVFFETHDPTQVDRQGADIGNQYRSEVFYLNENQKQIATGLVNQLIANDYKIATRITKATEFWHAEDYHQNYFAHKGVAPYCHTPVKRF